MVQPVAWSLISFHYKEKSETILVLLDRSAIWLSAGRVTPHIASEGSQLQYQKPVSVNSLPEFQ
jgi:hypothetical protein